MQKHIVLSKSLEASVHFCLYLLNALTKCNDVWYTYAAVDVEYCSE